MTTAGGVAGASSAVSRKLGLQDRIGDQGHKLSERSGGPQSAPKVYYSATRAVVDRLPLSSVRRNGLSDRVIPGGADGQTGSQADR